MEFAVIMSPESIHVGSSIGAMNLCSHSNTFIPFSSTTLGGKPGFTKIEVDEDLYMIYPQHSIVDGLEAFDPDGVLIFTLNTEVYEAIDEIVKKFPVAWRCNVNFIELFLRPDMRSALPHMLNMPSKVDGVVCATEKVEKDLNYMGWRNTVTIPTAIDVSSFEESESDGDVVVSMTRMSSIKNLVTCIFAMRSIVQHNPSVEYRIYGKGELEDYIEQLIGMTGTDRISYEGYEDNDKILQEAKVLLQLSLSENQSLAPIEALASKVPVVCSSIDGHPSKGACRVPHDSIHETADAVEKLLNDDEFYEKKQKEGFEEAKQHDIEKIEKQYVSLLEKLENLEGDFKA